MSGHALFVLAAYAVSAVGIAGLVGWILLDGRAQRRAIAALEAGGVRRRSAGAGEGADRAGTGGTGIPRA